MLSSEETLVLIANVKRLHLCHGVGLLASGSQALENFNHAAVLARIMRFVDGSFPETSLLRSKLPVESFHLLPVTVAGTAMVFHHSSLAPRVNVAHSLHETPRVVTLRILVRQAVAGKEISLEMSGDL